MVLGRAALQFPETTPLEGRLGEAAESESDAAAAEARQEAAAKASSLADEKSDKRQR
jgi:hypothetical protein